MYHCRWLDGLREEGRSGVDFAKYHGLGNDYIVVDQAVLPELPLEVVVPAICDRHRGPGADGVLVHDGMNSAGEQVVRIINPDGSEAEKSGNGLRIFARYLWDADEVGPGAFTIRTAGGLVQATVAEGGAAVTVEMGEARFLSLHGSMEHDGEVIEYHSVSIGNPHCVIFGTASEERALRLGPVIECDSRFPARTNVQFVEVTDRENLRIEIWERGAGYTLASGSSSCAAAAAARRLGRVDENVNVNMPGGALRIHIGDDYQLTMRGPVAKVMDGRISDEVFDRPTDRSV